MGLGPVTHLGHLHAIPLEPFCRYPSIIMEERIFVLQASDNDITIQHLQNRFLIVLIDHFSNIIDTILKEVYPFAGIFIDNIVKLSTIQRDAEQSRIDIDIEYRFELIRKAHDAVNIFLMFRFSAILCIHLDKTNGDKLRRIINSFGLCKHKARVLVFRSIESSEHDRQALLMHKLCGHHIS